MGEQRSTVAIASSSDPELGTLSAPLDAPVTYEQVDAVVRRALELDRSQRSLPNTVKEGDWVVFKPNIVTSPSHKACSYWHNGVPHPGQVTDLRVIKSLIGFLLEHCRPGRVTVAEGGAEWTRGTGKNGEDGWTASWPDFDGLSYTGIVAEFEKTHPGIVDIIDLDEDDIRFGPVPDQHNSGIGAMQLIGQTMRPPEQFGRGAYVPGTGDLRQGFHIPVTILDCDRVVSVAPLKTHSCATSLAIKNYVGILPDHRSRVVRKHDVHAGDFQKGFVDLFSYHPADYSVLEGFWSTEGNGPQWGDNLRHNAVVVSADAVAADAMASELMGFNPEDIDYLHYAARKGYGTFDAEEIALAGGPISRVTRKFRTAAGRKAVPFTARGNRSWLVCRTVTEAWERLDSEERYIDLAAHFADESVQAASAAVTVRSSRRQSGWLWVGADGPIRVEVNGEVMVEERAPGGHRLGEYRVEVELPEGESLLRVFVARGESGMGFTALLCADDGYGLRGIEYCPAISSAIP